MVLRIITKSDDGVLTYDEVDEFVPIKFDGETFWFEDDDGGEVGISLEELESAMDFYDLLIEMGEI